MPTMRAISFERPGTAKELTVLDVPIPTPQTGELLIKVTHAAVNRTDIVRREAADQTPPYPILGVEVAGEIVESLSSDPKWTKGARVCGLVNLGGYAEFAVMPAERAILIPDTFRMEEAAGLPEVFLTAFQTLYWLGELQAEETVLIHAGASGVGTAAIQLAKKLSHARVIVTAGSEEKLAFCRSLGADETINYHTQSFDQEIDRLTNGRGVNVILDFIGASYFHKNLASIAVDGRWVMIGTLGGSTVEDVAIHSIIEKRIQLIGTLLTPRSDAYKAELTADFMAHTNTYLADGSIKPIIDRVFPLSEVKAAHQYMEDNRNIGKIILAIDEKRG